MNKDNFSPQKKINHSKSLLTNIKNQYFNISKKRSKSLHQKTVTFADEIGQNLTESIYYKPEHHSFDDSDLNIYTDSLNIFDKNKKYNVFNKFNFENYRNINTIINTNKYLLFSNHITIKTVFIRNFTLNFLIVVHNISYHKIVNIHYSNNNWKSKFIQSANYFYKHDDNFDIFTTKIFVNKDFILSNEYKCFEFAIEYQVNNQVFWDNNFGKNYKISNYQNDNNTSLCIE